MTSIVPGEFCKFENRNINMFSLIGTFLCATFITSSGLVCAFLLFIQPLTKTKIFRVECYDHTRSSKMLGVNARTDTGRDCVLLTFCVVNNCTQPMINANFVNFVPL